jgi:hypothetical protein
MTSTFTTTNAANLNTVLHGDCVEIMRHMRPDGYYRPVLTEMAGREGLAAKATPLLR